MQVHGPSVHLEHPGQRVRARLSGKTAVLEIGPVFVHVDSPEEADILIAAAVEAKSLLLTARHYSPEQMAELAPGPAGDEAAAVPA